MTKSEKDGKFKWTKDKLKVAKLLAEGELSHGEIADIFQKKQQFISRLKENPEFLEKIDEFILADDRATKAGILKAALDAAEIKKKEIKDDKSTYLDYLKVVADIQGHNKKTLAIEGEITNINKEVVVVAGDAKSRALVNELLGRMEEQKNG